MSGISGLNILGCPGVAKFISTSLDLAPIKKVGSEVTTSESVVRCFTTIATTTITQVSWPWLWSNIPKFHKIERDAAAVLLVHSGDLVVSTVGLQLRGHKFDSRFRQSFSENLQFLNI